MSRREELQDPQRVVIEPPLPKPKQRADGRAGSMFAIERLQLRSGTRAESGPGREAQVHHERHARSSSVQRCDGTRRAHQRHGAHRIHSALTISRGVGKGTFLQSQRLSSGVLRDFNARHSLERWSRPHALRVP